LRYTHNQEPKMNGTGVTFTSEVRTVNIFVLWKVGILTHGIRATLTFIDVRINFIQVCGFIKELFEITRVQTAFGLQTRNFGAHKNSLPLTRILQISVV
jgi:hypothetical protein